MKQAIRNKIEALKRAEYRLSFKKAAGYPEMKIMAEEGLEDYLRILDQQKNDAIPA